jgi:hypothetical protein
MHAAGKSTQQPNNSTFAPPHAAQKNALVMESYDRPFKKTSEFSSNSSEPSMWSLLQLDHTGNDQFHPEQGAHTTRFHKGFMRRQAGSINPYATRLESEAAREEKKAASTEVRRAYLEQKQTFKVRARARTARGALVYTARLPLAHPPHGRAFSRLRAPSVVAGERLQPLHGRGAWRRAAAPARAQARGRR